MDSQLTEIDLELLIISMNAILKVCQVLIFDFVQKSIQFVDNQFQWWFWECFFWTVSLELNLDLNYII